jgi:hypothetical protein
LGDAFEQLRDAVFLTQVHSQEIRASSGRADTPRDRLCGGLLTSTADDNLRSLVGEKPENTIADSTVEPVTTATLSFKREPLMTYPLVW